MTAACSAAEVRRHITSDRTIIVRVWLEAHTDEPCGRLIRVGSEDEEERTVCGFEEIVRTFDVMIREAFEDR